MNTDVLCSIIKVILKFITIVVSAAVICSIFEYTVRKIYFKLQNLYIKKSGDKHMIYEKLLVTNYNVYNCLETFFNFINPIKIYDEYHKTYFDIKIFSYSGESLILSESNEVFDSKISAIIEVNLTKSSSENVMKYYSP